ncbi:nucleoside diphosphate kinase [Lactococcus hodotermopsidis]|uniref:Nucleoside diphosphate kinase n=1 Tax=Pseudolactococcus hodotermopsidis TaxID=2709157 RepID=A0A6A0BCX7_9LACT|nr:nucleoside-diphosphate kinase [Lactococcus hodotermopsidis]GFH42696.1 nucleoside diphosphate kinase [Lactococcus hodotermopsidis]
MEKTLFIIKPDGVRRSLVGQVIERIERRGFLLERLEMREVTKDLLEVHYADIASKPFYGEVVDYMTSGSVVVGVLCGSDVILSWRKMMGATNPSDALPGTIRGDFAHASDDDSIENIVHGSDSAENAAREIAIWFGE